MDGWVFGAGRPPPIPHRVLRKAGKTASECSAGSVRWVLPRNCRKVAAAKNLTLILRQTTMNRIGSVTTIAPFEPATHDVPARELCPTHDEGAMLTLWPGKRVTAVESPRCQVVSRSEI